MYFFFAIPLIYVALGIFYAPVALARRGYLYFSQDDLSPEDRENLLKVSKLDRSLNPREIFSLIASIGVLLTLLALPLARTGWFEDIGGLLIAGLLITPGVVFGVDMKSMWSRTAVRREYGQWQARNKLAMVRQIFTLAVGVVGCIGSYLIAILYPVVLNS